MLRTNDQNALREFYPAVKKNTIFTMGLNTGPDGVISFPVEGNKTEWWEGFHWEGMAAHAGSLKISQLLIAKKMAEAMGDEDFIDQCEDWIAQGQKSMEEKMWNEPVGSYWMFRDPDVTGLEDDKIMSNQFDAEWTNWYHGVERVYREDRVKRGLDTIKKSCLAPYGAVSFADTDLTPLVTYGIFTPEIMILAFTYRYEGDMETGMKILHDCMHNCVIDERYPWDLPNMIAGKPTWTPAGESVSVDGEGTGTGERTFGHDYYQNMMLWAAPAAIAKQTLGESGAPGTFIDRVMQAGKTPRSM